MNKKTLLTSLMSIAMLASIASGATYALFTAEDNVNIAINAAKVNVKATISDLSLSSKVGSNETIGSWANGGTATLTNNQITLTNMTPGDKVSFNITVTNNSNVRVQSRNTYVASGELLGALNITGFGSAQSVGFSNWEVLEVGSAPVTYPIEITFDENAGDEYQEKTAVIDFAVEAVQGNAEVVNPYDYDASTHTYTINDEAGMMMLGDLASNFYDYGGGNRWNVKLSKDMDMSSYEWKGLTFGHFTTLDGQGHTVKNLNCVMDEMGRSGFISIVKNTMVENLVLENVNCAGTQAGIVAGHALHGDGSYTHFKNVTIKGNNTVSYQKSSYEYQEEYNGVGAVFGVGKKFTDDAITIADGATVTVNYNGMVTRMETGNEFAFRFNSDVEVPVVNNGTVVVNGEVAIKKDVSNDAAFDSTISEAFASGEKVNIELAAGTYTLPSNSASADITITGTKDSVVDITLGAYLENSSVAFEGVTIKGSTGKANGNGSDYAALYSYDVTYTNCYFDGGFRVGRDGAKFIECTFDLTSNSNTGVEYVWAYGNDVTFEKCTFNTDGKAILLYSDGPGTNTADGISSVVVNECTFNATRGNTAYAIANQNCAAIEIDNHGNGANLTTSGNTYSSNFSGEWRIKSYYSGRQSVTVNGTAYTSLALDGKTMTIDSNRNVTIVD